MKTISDYLKPLNEKLDLKDVDINSSDILLKKIGKNNEKIEKILKKMDLGKLKYEITSDRITFTLGRRYEFWIELRRYMTDKNEDNPLRVSSIASYGDFYQDDECWEFYKSLGLILSQTAELDQIKEILKDNNELIRLNYKND